MSKKTIEQSNEGAHSIQPRQFGLFNRIQILPPAELKKILGAFTDEVQKCIASGNDDLRDLFEVVVSRRLQSFAAETVQSVRDIGSKTNAEIEEILQAETAKLVKAAAMSGERFEEMFGEIQAQILDLQFMPDELKEYLQNTQADLENSIKQSEIEIVSKIEQAKQEIIDNTNAQFRNEINSRLETLKKEIRRRYIQTDEIKNICDGIIQSGAAPHEKSIAELCKALCGTNNEVKITQIKEYIAGLNSTQTREQYAEYFNDVVKLCKDLLQKELFLPAGEIIDRAHELKLLLERDYDMWLSDFEQEKEKIDNEVYNLTGRVVFIAYKSEDMAEVMELCKYLENNGLKCFVAARNLQRSVGGNYRIKLQEALRNCKALVFVSTALSRSKGDAVEKEFDDFIEIEKALARENGFVVTEYEDIPPVCKKPCVEYLVEEYGKTEFVRENIKMLFGAETWIRDKGKAVRYIKNQIADRKRERQRMNEQRLGITRPDITEPLSQPPKAVEQPKAPPPEQPKKPEPSTPKTSDVITKPVAPKQPDYPTLSNCDETEFEIKGTTLTKYRGKGGTVKVPMGIKKIGVNAFSYCDSLTSIDIPNSVEIIGEGAFYGCSGLTGIYIPSSVTSIAIRAFHYCSSLTSLEVEIGNTSYHSNGDCIIETATKTLITGCKNSVIPTDGSVTSIGRSAFYGCCKLTSIRIPDGVTSIEYVAFSGCSSLTHIEIPNDIKNIANEAFDSCSNLTHIEIPNSVERIGFSAFYGCSSLTQVKMPKRFESERRRIFGDMYNDIEFTFTEYSGRDSSLCSE